MKMEREYYLVCKYSATIDSKNFFFKWKGKVFSSSFYFSLGIIAGFYNFCNKLVLKVVFNLDSKPDYLKF